MKKIVHLTSVHSAHDVRIFRKQAKTLAVAGYEAVIVAPHDQKQVEGVVRIHGIQKPRNRAERMFLTVWRVLRAALAEKASLYHFHDSELIPVGVFLKLIGKRVIYDVHENVPEDVRTKAYIPRPLRPLMAYLVMLFQRVAAQVLDAIVAATPAIARDFPVRKTRVIQNFPILGELVTPGSLAYEERDPVVTYVGGITEVRGIREMVEAMGMIPENRAAKLLLAGEFASQALVESLSRSSGWKRVEALGWLSRSQVADVLGCSRLGIVVFHPLGNHIEAQPNKLFEYMSAGIPVLASDFPLWRQLVEDAGCGLVVDPRDPKAIATAITWILDHPDQAEQMGKSGAAAVRNRYNWQIESRELLRLYESLLPD